MYFTQVCPHTSALVTTGVTEGVEAAAHSADEHSKMRGLYCVQDFGCSRDDFNCQCPQVVNASSSAPAGARS